MFAFSLSQLERMVNRSTRAIFLYLAAGYDLAHCLQLCDHHSEVQTNMTLIFSIMQLFIESNCLLRTCFTTIALSYLPVWLTLDYLSDLMYIFDMIITVHTGKCFIYNFELVIGVRKIMQTHRKIFFIILKSYYFKGKMLIRTGSYISI